jgi:hypothetical protein
MPRHAGSTLEKRRLRRMRAAKRVRLETNHTMKRRAAK